MTTDPTRTDAVLLDANVLIAAHFEDHVHFTVADTWLKGRRFASTPSTQGSLLRYALRITDPERAATLIDVLSENNNHEFWADNASYRSAMLVGISGHRQLTDAYLADAATRHNTRLVTFDACLKALRPEVVELLRPDGSDAATQ